MNDEILFGTTLIIIILGITTISVIAGPIYNVWNKEMGGKAALAESEWSKKVQIEEAKANLEAEKYNALAEIERAKGVAESNIIISGSLDENYLKYLWINGLNNENTEVIYVPTEANLPILEAGRFNK